MFSFLRRKPKQEKIPDGPKVRSVCLTPEQTLKACKLWDTYWKCPEECGNEARFELWSYVETLIPKDWNSFSGSMSINKGMATRWEIVWSPRESQKEKS